MGFLMVTGVLDPIYGNQITVECGTLPWRKPGFLPIGQLPENISPGL